MVTDHIKEDTIQEAWFKANIYISVERHGNHPNKNIIKQRSQLHGQSNITILKRKNNYYNIEIVNDTLSTACHDLG